MVVDLDRPLLPKVLSRTKLENPRALAIQFRYAFVVGATGFTVFDISKHDKPREIKGAPIALGDARGIYLARTYAYVAGGSEGLVIVDIEKPEEPKNLRKI